MNLTQVSECSPCSPGHFCASPGLQAPTGLCKGGYFCGGGSSVSDPHDSGASVFRASYAGETCVQVRNGTVNDVCPEGHYCPEGSSSPVPCPQGTDSTSRGLSSASQCPLCAAGYYCPRTGALLATRQCREGYFLSAGHGGPEERHQQPRICEAGTYQDDLGQAACKTCPSFFIPTFCFLITTFSFIKSYSCLMRLVYKPNMLDRF
jgi:hypothetical protein